MVKQLKSAQHAHRKGKLLTEQSPTCRENTNIHANRGKQIILTCAAQSTACMYPFMTSVEGFSAPAGISASSVQPGDEAGPVLTDRQMASQKALISWGSLHRLPSDSLAAGPASGTDCGSGVLNESSGLWLPLTLKKKTVLLWCGSDLQNSLAFLHHTSIDESNWDLQFHEQLGHNVASSKAIRCAEIAIEWVKLLFICGWKRRNILCCKVFVECWLFILN